MKQDDNKLLEVFLATSGYTIQAIEQAIDDLRESVSNNTSPVIREIYLKRVEELEDYLKTIQEGSL